jgi:hypothetical protein
VPILDLEIVHRSHSVEVDLVFINLILTHELVHFVRHSKTVHLRHVDICEDDPEGWVSIDEALFELADALASTKSRFRFQLEVLLQHQLQRVHIERVIVHYKHLSMPRSTTFLPLFLHITIILCY